MRKLIIILLISCSGIVSAQEFQSVYITRRPTVSSGPSLSYTNLDHWYSFDESSGDLIDLHGSDDGTVTGADYSATGKVGTAYDFEASDAGDYVTLDAGFNYGSDDFSIVMWIRPETMSNTLIGGTTNSACLAILNVDGDLILLKDGGSNCSTSGLSMSTGTYYMVSMTYDQTADEVVFYVNTDSETESYEGTFSAVTNTIGARLASDYSFDGLIDEVSIWSDVLTPTEIGILYNSGNGLGYGD